MKRETRFFIVVWVSSLVLGASAFWLPSHFSHAAGWPDHIDGRLWHGLMTQSLASRVALWVRAHDGRAASSLRALGLDAEVGQWHSVQWDSPTLTLGLMAPGTLEVRQAPKHRPFGLRSLAAIGARDVHRGRASAGTKLTGRGVLIGLIDTGLDLEHPAFLGRDGKSRVIGFWDQDDATGPRPPGFDYGTSCDHETIRSGHCHLSDWLGHGTHVAGIAAGNTHLVGGIAPEADIAVVRSHAFDHIADAALYLLRLAKARHQPLALNISVGGHYGPHDGQSPLELFLARQASAGVVMVAAAGNEGDRRLHITIPRQSLNSTDAGTPVRIALQAAPSTPLQQPNHAATTLLELWGDVNPQRLQAELWYHGQCLTQVPLTYDGDAHALVWSDQVVSTLRAKVEKRKYAVNSSGLRTPAREGLSVSITPLHPALQLIGAQIVLAVTPAPGAGPPTQGWLSAADGSPSPVNFSVPASSWEGEWLAGDFDAGIAVPATSPDIITVGSVTVQTHWFDAGQNPRGLSHEVLGSLSSFSSRGPTGAPDFTGQKPDLVAPGSVVVSARARGVDDSADVLGPLTMVMQGTSMSAPHVTGTVALMLQARPRLKQHQARQLLVSTAKRAVDTDRGVNPRYGAGQLDAFAAVSGAGALNQGCCAASMPAVTGWFWLPLAVRHARRRGWLERSSSGRKRW